MSIDSEPSPAGGRDCFFPTPSFIGTASSSPSPQYIRRFSSTSKPRLSRPYTPNSHSGRVVSPLNSTPYNDFNRPPIRRRVKFSRTREKESFLGHKPEASDGFSGRKVEAGVAVSPENAFARKKLAGFLFRWQIPFMVVILSEFVLLSYFYKVKFSSLFFVMVWCRF